MGYYLGVDVSTTATKAILIEADGTILAVASSNYPYESPHPLWREQDPRLWWTAATESIQGVLQSAGLPGREIQGIGLTGQMHGLVLLDKYGEVLRPAILWNDQRVGPQCEEIRVKVGKSRLLQVTGNDAFPGFTAPKILWVREKEPGVHANAAHILLPKDYIRFRLTGDYATDRADGSGTLLFDLEERMWSTEILKTLAIDPGLLPATFEGTDVTGVVSARAASETGLAAGTPVVGGGGDQAAAAVGTGAVEEGIVSLSLGTSGVIFATTNRPAVDPQGLLHSFCHALPARWHMMGVMLSAGGSLSWHREAFAPRSDFDSLVEPARTVPPGSDGVLFMPYLTGERTPHPDPLARGAFVGLTTQHRLPHLTRAVLEGVAFGLRDILELMKHAGLQAAAEIRVTGGGASSVLWKQILADVLGASLVTTTSKEGAAFGAALLAATGLGVYEGVMEACREAIAIEGRTAPGPSMACYQDLYPVYRGLYSALRPSFEAVGQRRSPSPAGAPAQRGAGYL